MMAEAFLRLRPFGAVESYRYVGMGSVYFADFALFHATCGFETMVSVEEVSDEIAQKRFRFNVPLGNIALHFDHTNSALPRLKWDYRTVAWLDYDEQIAASILADVRYVATQMTIGSALAVTVRADLADDETRGRKNLDVLVERVGEAKLPDWVVIARAVKPQQIVSALRDILTQEVFDGVNDRNAGRPSAQKYAFKQVMFFTYQDGAPMMTLCWILFDEGTRPTFNMCDFVGLKSFRDEGIPFRIEIPHITNAEVREINRCFEDQQRAELPIPSVEIDRYQELRRYWPIFINPELT
jgi:hypothetical protein